MICVTIDGCDFQTEPDRTILQVAREQAIHIPTICHHEALEPVAACRLCVVEVKSGKAWRLVAACAFPCADGLVVRTHSERILRSRRLTVELLMASASHIPLIQQLADELGVGEPRFTLERDDCILCGLCVRACKEIVGVAAISVINRGIEKRVSPPFEVASNSCIECGTCILMCPTGALTLGDITGGKRSIHPWDSPLTAPDCHICGNSHLAAKLIDTSIILAEPVTSPVTIRDEADA